MGVRPLTHLCPSILGKERIQVINLHNHFAFSSLENILKEQLFKTSGRQFHKWLLGTETLFGLQETGPRFH